MHMQAITSLQQRLAGAELDRDTERKQSSSLQAQLDALQGRYNQATAYLEVLLTACGACGCMRCCVVLHLQLVALASIPYSDNAPSVSNEQTCKHMVNIVRGLCKPQFRCLVSSINGPLSFAPIFHSSSTQLPVAAP